MVREVLFFIVIANFWCFSWCLPNRDIFEGFDVIRDERQKNTGGDGFFGGGNVHLKFDGLLVAVPEVTPDQIGMGDLPGKLFELIFGLLEHRPTEKIDNIPVHEEPQRITTTSAAPPTEVTEAEKNFETTTVVITTTIDGNTETVTS